MRMPRWGRVWPPTNVAPKLLALVAAIGVWFFATAEQRESVERGVTVPLEVRGVSGRSYSGVPPTVRVTVRGPRGPVTNLSGRDVTAAIDLSEQPEGDFVATVTATAPGSLVVVGSDPPRVSGLLEDQVSREFPVTVSMVFSPEASVLARYVSTPEEVTVLGVQGAVNSVATVVTAPVALEPGGSTQVPLVALDGAGAVVPDVLFAPGTVNLRRVDRQNLPVRTLPVQLNTPPPDLEVVFGLVQPSAARVLGGEGLSVLPLEVNYRAGTYTTPGTPQLPPGAVLLDEIAVSLEVRPRPTPPAPPAAPAPQPTAPAVVLQPPEGEPTPTVPAGE